MRIETFKDAHDALTGIDVRDVRLSDGFYEAIVGAPDQSTRRFQAKDLETLVRRVRFWAPKNLGRVA